MSRRRLAVAAFLMSLSACAHPQALSVSNPSGDGTSGKLAPDVPVPLDITSYAADPCSILDADQPAAKDLGESTSDGPTCTWHARTPQQPEMTVTVDVQSGGLESLYRNRSQLPYFEPTSIASYPAVRYDKERSVPDQGRCTVSVGIAETQMVTVTSRIADSGTLNYPVPCPDTDLFATAIMKSVMKG